MMNLGFPKTKAESDWV